MSIKSLQSRIVTDYTLPIISLAVITALPFIEIAEANISNGINIPRLLRHYASALQFVLLLAIVLRIVLRPLPFWRVATAFVPVVFLFFAFDRVSLALSLGYGFPTPEIGDTSSLLDRFPVLLATWLLALLAVLGICLYWVRHQRVVVSSALICLALLVPPLWSLFHQSNEIVAPPNLIKINDFLFGAPAADYPNIYWVVADGYPRGDVLLNDFQYDNSGFLEQLEGRGFIVLPSVWANYPLTIYSIASIVEMSYPINENSKAEHVKDLSYFRQIIRGESTLVSSLRQLGYRYVHFANGYDNLTICGGKEDICLVGNKGADELDTVILGRTPLLSAMAWVNHWFGNGNTGNSLFSWRAFDEVTDKLPEIRETRSPFLLYAHVISPHPPLRYKSNCEFRPSAPDLITWNPSNKQNFIDQIRCSNIQLEQLIDNIIKKDPSAIILLNGDHGSAFRQPFIVEPEKWSPDQFIERMAPLVALKLPVNCREQVSQMGSLVNMFRIVLGCVSGRELPLLETKTFVTPYDNSPDFGKIYLYTNP